MSRDHESEFLDDDLWNASYPVAVFYVRYIAPFVLLFFFVSFSNFLFLGLMTSAKEIVPLLCVVIYSLFHWRAFNDLKNRRPYDAGTAKSIRPGDSVISARWAIATAIFDHFSIVLGLTLYYIVNMKK